MRLLLLSLLLTPFSAFAHGDAPSLEAQEGDYMMDIGYTPELAPNTDIEFDLDLFTSDPIDYADFSSVDVRVTRNGGEIAAGSIPNDEVHIPTFTVKFPEPGGYDIDIRYLDAANALIAAHTFHVEVPGDSTVMMRNAEDTLHYVLAAGLFALSFGIGGYALWQRFGPKKKR